MIPDDTLVTAAGGNGTVIRILDAPLAREAYAQQGKEILSKEMEAAGAEQAGFLIPSSNHFEMAGGEFCGNATRAAAVLLSELEGRPEVTFTVSGFDGMVTGLIDKKSDDRYNARCQFPGMTAKIQPTILADGTKTTIVDLGGITHVIIQGEFPAGDYEQRHRDITTELHLEGCGVVGVVWFQQNRNTVTIHPVVWVKDVDTFYYETSCGSGSIATAYVTGLDSIIQPTGQSIEVSIAKELVTLASKMQVIRSVNTR